MPNKSQNFENIRILLSFCKKCMVQYIDNLKIDNIQKRGLQKEIWVNVRGRLKTILKLKELNDKKSCINKEMAENLTNDTCMQVWGRIYIAKFLSIPKECICFDYESNKTDWLKGLWVKI